MNINQNPDNDSVPVGTDVDVTPTGDEPTIDIDSQESKPEATVIDFDPKQWPLTYKGKQVYPKDKTHFVNLAQKGWSYEDRLGALTEQEKALAEREAQLDELENLQKLAVAWKANPAFVQRIQEIYNESLNQPQDEVTGEDNKDIDAKIQSAVNQILQPKLQKIDQYEEKIAQEDADRNVAVEISQLKQEYSTNDWETKNAEGKTLIDEIIQYALDNKLDSYPLDHVYRVYMFDTVRDNTQAETLKAEQDANIRKKKAGIVTDSGTQPISSEPKKVNVRDINYNDVAKYALKSGKLTTAD